MSRFVSLAASVLTLLALLPSAQAQAFKVGYVDTDQIVIRMPEFAQVQQQLQQQQIGVATRVRTLQDSLGQVLQTRVAEYETFDQSALATDEARLERQNEILQLQAAREQTEAEGLQYLSYVEARLLQPVLTRVDEAIQAELNENGYDLILPTVANNAPVFLAASERVVDVTVAIMTRLGIDPSTPPVGQQAAPQPTPGVTPVPTGGEQ
ncbi:MAG: OmpH family outer membrane protein [Bacteroidota bacterium]